MLRRTYQLEGEPQASGQGTNPPPQTQDLAGFDDPAKLAQAYRGSSQEARLQKQRADLLEQQLGQFQQRFQQPASDPYQRLREEGWPVETLGQWVEQVAERKAAERFQPIAQGLEARGRVMSEYPDYQKHEADVAKWLNEDRERQSQYTEMFRANPAGAMDWAFLKYGEQQRRTQGPQPTGADAASKANAQIPSGRTGESRNRNAEGTQDTAQRAYNEWRKTQDPSAKEAFIRARLRSAISDDFFDRNR